jgi:hypothetical protein
MTKTVRDSLFYFKIKYRTKKLHSYTAKTWPGKSIIPGIYYVNHCINDHSISEKKNDFKKTYPLIRLMSS